MKKYKINTLKKKLKKFNIVIFDLDNTIYNEDNFIKPSLQKVSRFLSQEMKLEEKMVFFKLMKLKYKGNDQKIFNSFLSNYKLPNQKFTNLVKKSVKLYQTYNCKNLENSNSLKNYLKKLCKLKTLYLVTNGDYFRQKNKITKLKIQNYFKKIYILDRKRTDIKPSTKNLGNLKKIIKKEGAKYSVYVGDNSKIDKKFAENLKISFVKFIFKY